jgi:hypothetical protein
MPLSRRYYPEHAPGERCLYGMDFSYVIPPGVGIAQATLKMFTNVAVPQDVTLDWNITGPGIVRGRTIYITLQGGVEGTDYQLRWSATDTDGNIWPRTALLLCAQTS